MPKSAPCPTPSQQRDLDQVTRPCGLVSMWPQSSSPPYFRQRCARTCEVGVIVTGRMRRELSVGLLRAASLASASKAVEVQHVASRVARLGSPDQH